MADRMIVSGDFDEARRRAQIQKVLSTFRWKNPDLLSFYEVTKLIKPDAQFYKGMQTIPVKNIIGSENRYHDFSAAFYPKSHILQHRWESIDAARLDDIPLPPISVYKLGDWYFVRDGNHRVSVAKAKGQEFIDAEVVELSSKIPLEEGMTMNELKRRVVAYEREKFIEQYHPTYLPMDKIVFTSPGSYPEMVNHILVHKYYANEHLKKLFPGCTEADIYMWLVRRWDEMKRTDAYATQEAAAHDMKESEGKNRLKRWFQYLRQRLSRK